MDNAPPRRLVRLEAKINVIAHAVGWILALLVALGAYLVAPSHAWQPYAAYGAGLIAAAIFETGMRRVEKRFAEDDPYL